MDPLRHRPLQEIHNANASRGRLLRESWGGLEKYLARNSFTVFLDFDGTLTRAHERPELAELSEEMRGRLSRLATRVPVTIVSGRDRMDVASLVGLPELTYAGCHGFDVEESALPSMPKFKDAAMLVDVTALGVSVQEAVGAVPGVIVKVKRWAVAIHYRTVRAEDVEGLEDAMTALVAAAPKFRASQGRKVIEIIPDIDWHKGRAVMWLAEIFNQRDGPATPIYVGDDVTDEEAFYSLAGKGITVLVAKQSRPTAADYRVDDPDEVGWFLDKLFALAPVT